MTCIRRLHLTVRGMQDDTRYFCAVSFSKIIRLCSGQGIIIFSVSLLSFSICYSKNGRRDGVFLCSFLFKNSLVSILYSEYSIIIFSVLFSSFVLQFCRLKNIRRTKGLYAILFADYYFLLFIVQDYCSLFFVVDILSSIRLLFLVIVSSFAL